MKSPTKEPSAKEEQTGHDQRPKRRKSTISIPMLMSNHDQSQTKHDGGHNKINNIKLVHKQTSSTHRDFCGYDFNVESLQRKDIIQEMNKVEDGVVQQCKYQHEEERVQQIVGKELEKLGSNENISHPNVECDMKNSLPSINAANIKECVMVFKPLIPEESGKTPRTDFVNGLFGTESIGIPIKDLSHKLGGFDSHGEQQLDEEAIDKKGKEIEEKADIHQLNELGGFKTTVDQENLILTVNEDVDKSLQDRGKTIDGEQYDMTEGIDPIAAKKILGQTLKPCLDGTMRPPKRKRVWKPKLDYENLETVDPSIIEEQERIEEEIKQQIADEKVGNPLPKGSNPIDPLTGRKKRGRPKKCDSQHIKANELAMTIADEEEDHINSNNNVEASYQEVEQGNASEQGKPYDSNMNSVEVSPHLASSLQIHNDVDFDSSDLKKAFKLSQSFAVFDESFSNIPQSILKLKQELHSNLVTKPPPFIPERFTLNETLNTSSDQDVLFTGHSCEPQTRNSMTRDSYRRNSVSTCSGSWSVSADEETGSGIALPEEDPSYDVSMFYEGTGERVWSSKWTANAVKEWDVKNIPHHYSQKLNTSDSKISLEDNHQNYQLFCDALSDDNSLNLTRTSVKSGNVPLPESGQVETSQLKQNSLDLTNIPTVTSDMPDQYFETSDLLRSSILLTSSSPMPFPSSTSSTPLPSSFNSPYPLTFPVSPTSTNCIPEYSSNKVNYNRYEPSSSFINSDSKRPGTDIRLGTICCVGGEYVDVAEHIAAHKHEVARFKCNDCGVKFPKPHLFLEHVNKYHDLECSPHKCLEDCCRLVFPTEFSLKIHHQEFHVEERHKSKNKCSACSRKVLTASGEPDPHGEVLAPHIGEHALKVHQELWI